MNASTRLSMNGKSPMISTGFPAESIKVPVSDLETQRSAIASEGTDVMAGRA